jgi:cytochrome c oxidase subunit I
MGESLARFSLVAILIGAHLTLLPMFLAGLDGQQADVYKYFEDDLYADGVVGTFQSLDTYNLISSIGALVLVTGIVMSLVNAARSAGHGRRAGHDPWRGDTLEWLALSPPPPHNFDVVPDVRSDEPMRDIRDAVKRRHPPVPASRAKSGEPVA